MKMRTWILAATATVAVFGTSVLPTAAQRAGGPPAAPEGPPTAVKLEVAEGSRALYRVREQLAGISFPSDAVGQTSDVTGTLVFGADGAINTAQSKITVDLRTLKSDQDMRDGFIRGARGLNTEKFPMAEFVPKRAVGMPWPWPSAQPPQAGFQLVGDMTVYGSTQEVTWNVVATFAPTAVAGRATTTFTFEKFGIPKPQLARLMSVDDNINLELDLRFTRSPM